MLSDTSKQPKKNYITYKFEKINRVAILEFVYGKLGLKYRYS